MYGLVRESVCVREQKNKMGSCFSTEATGEMTEQKKRSQMIDRRLEEDSRQLRRECKILLLGSFQIPALLQKISSIHHESTNA